MVRVSNKFVSCLRRCVTKKLVEWNPNIAGAYAEWLVWLECKKKCEEEVTK